MSNTTTLKPAKLVTITPEMAQKILNEKNTLNRPLSDKHVAKLVDEIREGRWRVNGDTIRMGKTRLLDGQHRLWAIVLSGIPVQTFLVEGLDDDVFQTIDGLHRRRTAADTLSLRGERNASRLAAALVVVDKYMTGRSDRTVDYTPGEVAELLDEYPGIRDSIQTQCKASGLLPGSLYDACHYLFSQKDPTLADEFVDKVSRGVGLEEGSPWYTLRNRLLQNSMSKAKLTRPYMFALTIKAWNCARGGKKMKQLRWRDKGETAEPFPVIL
jgi:hypothetical protein